MIRIQTALALSAAMMVASCATGYGPQTGAGGYTDEKLDNTHFRVKFEGNRHTTQERMWSFWIYRCAELTRQQGYTHFALQRQTQSPGQAPARSVPQSPARWEDTDAIIAMYRAPLPEYVMVLRAQAVIDELGPYVESNGSTSPVTRTELYRRASLMRNRPQLDYSFGGEL